MKSVQSVRLLDFFVTLAGGQNQTPNWPCKPIECVRVDAWSPDGTPLVSGEHACIAVAKSP
jgi:hypothetical protein